MTRSFGPIRASEPYFEQTSTRSVCIVEPPTWRSSQSLEKPADHGPLMCRSRYQPEMILAAVRTVIKDRAERSKVLQPTAALLNMPDMIKQENKTQAKLF